MLPFSHDEENPERENMEKQEHKDHHEKLNIEQKNEDQLLHNKEPNNMI